MVYSTPSMYVILDAHNRKEDSAVFHISGITIELLWLDNSPKSAMDADVVMFEYAPEEDENPVKNHHKLDELPGEIISMIGENLTREELRRVRGAGSRRLREKIDHIFVCTIYSSQASSC
jgi:hypothetical protein